MSVAGDAAGRPPVWQAVLIAAAFATLAAGSCAGFLTYAFEDPLGRDERYALLFLVSTVLAGGPLVLALFRVWRRRHGDAWPTVTQTGLIIIGGMVAAVAGYAGAIAMATVVPYRWRIEPLFYALIAVAAVGLAVVFGAVELLAVGAWRRTVGRTR